MQFRPLSQEDSLEEEITTPSSILARITPWTEEPGRSPSMGVAYSERLLSVHTHTCTQITCNPPPLLFLKLFLKFFCQFSSNNSFLTCLNWIILVKLLTQ